MSKESIAKVNLDVPNDMSVSFNKKNDTPVSFSMIGNGKLNRKSKLKSVDLIEEMITMTKPEIFAVYVLRNRSRWHVCEISGRKYSEGISYITQDTWESDAEHQMFTKGMKKLVLKGLALKLNNIQYMINPLAIIPSERETAIRQWNISVKNHEHKISND